MITFKTPTGHAIPIKEFDRIQKENLKKIKYEKRQISEMGKLTAYYPEIMFKNVVRLNSDGSKDIVIDSGVATELHTGFLPKRSYKALRVKEEKKALMNTPKDSYDIIQVSETDIVREFNAPSYSIADIEKILESSIKKGTKYFD